MGPWSRPFRSPADCQHRNLPWPRRHDISSCSERNLVVEIAALAAPARHRGLPFARGWARRAEVAAVAIITAATSAAARAIEHGERRVEALQHHFGRVLLDALLVCPFARLQRAFEVNLGAL